MHGAILLCSKIAAGILQQDAVSQQGPIVSQQDNVIPQQGSVNSQQGMPIVCF
jgi:hypothetical protein